MTDQQINLAMAEAMGWRKEDGVYMWTANGIDHTCPELWDWANDLNAMHLAEKTLTEDQRSIFYPRLLGGWMSPVAVIYATARQRAEAFLKTFGKYIE